jgi:hypothetical protein
MADTEKSGKIPSQKSGAKVGDTQGTFATPDDRFIANQSESCATGPPHS